MATTCGYPDGEKIRLVVSYTHSNGRRYEAGWTGTICPLFTSIEDCQESDSYEINLDDAPSGEDRGMINVPSTYFERSSPTRLEGELRQGDRVKLLADVQGDNELYEAGTVVTVIDTRAKVNRLSHDVVVDFGETLTVSRECLDRAPGGYADVRWSADQGLEVSFCEGSPI